MANRAAVFKQVDVKRATKGVIDAGLKVARVEIDRDGRIVVYSGDASINARDSNDWDE